MTPTLREAIKSHLRTQGHGYKQNMTKDQLQNYGADMFNTALDIALDDYDLVREDVSKDELKSFKLVFTKLITPKQHKPSNRRAESANDYTTAFRQWGIKGRGVRREQA